MAALEFERPPLNMGAVIGYLSRLLDQIAAAFDEVQATDAMALDANSVSPYSLAPGSLQILPTMALNVDSDEQGNFQAAPASANGAHLAAVGVTGNNAVKVGASCLVAGNGAGSGAVTFRLHIQSNTADQAAGWVTVRSTVDQLPSSGGAKTCRVVGATAPGSDPEHYRVAIEWLAGPVGSGVRLSDGVSDALAASDATALGAELIR